MGSQGDVWAKRKGMQPKGTLAQRHNVQATCRFGQARNFGQRQRHKIRPRKGQGTSDSHKVVCSISRRCQMLPRDGRRHRKKLAATVKYSRWQIPINKLPHWHFANGTVCILKMVSSLAVGGYVASRWFNIVENATARALYGKELQVDPPYPWPPFFNDNRVNNTTTTGFITAA